MGETSVVAVRAAVYHYNPGTNTWASADRGLSRLDLYHSQQTRRYRVVGVSAKTGDTVINSPLTRAVVYQQVTPLFHQWSDTLFSYGVNFATLEEAQGFAQAVDAAVLHMGADDVPPPPVFTTSAPSALPAAAASERGASARSSESTRSERSDKDAHEKKKRAPSTSGSSGGGGSSSSGGGSISRREVEALRAELQQCVLNEIAAALGTTARLSRGPDAPVPEVSPSKARRRDSKRISLHMKKDKDRDKEREKEKERDAPVPPVDGIPPPESRSGHSSHGSCSTPRHANTVVITPPPDAPN